MATESTILPQDYSAALRKIAGALASRPGSVDYVPARGFWATLSELLSGSSDVEQILRLALGEATESVHARRAYIALVDEGARPTFTAMEGAENASRILAQTRGVVEWVCHNKQTLHLSSAEGDARARGLPPGTGLLGVPLMGAQEILGLLYLERSSGDRPFADRDIAKIEGLGAYAALAITNNRFVSQIAGQVRKYQNINEVSLAISAILQLDDLLALILERCLSLTEGQQGYILLGERENLTCLASRDDQGQSIDEIEVSHSIVNRCLAENASVCILDTHEDLANQSASVLALDLRSVMAVPLVANQHPIGVMYISSQAITKTFTNQDQSLLEAIANQAALAIRNAQLLKEQEHQILELERALELVKEAQRRAVTDGLTGLYNHVYFKEQLYGAVLEAQRYGNPLSVIILDLDHFKKVNDTYGHQTGDEILKHAASIFRGSIRDCDVLARYGGEEMAVVLPQTDRAGAIIVAERIRSALEGTPAKTSGGHELTVTASFGVACFKPGSSATDLFERADRALYVAKSSGRNRVWMDGSTVAAAIDGGRGLSERSQGALNETFRAFEDVPDTPGN